MVIGGRGRGGPVQGPLKNPPDPPAFCKPTRVISSSLEKNRPLSQSTKDVNQDMAAMG